MSLTVTSIPSKQFSNTDSLTIPRLNLLGQPTFSITGTLSTSEIADGAITAAKATPGAFFYGDGTLSGGVYSIDLTPNMPAGYVTGAHIYFKAGTVNAGATDVNCDGLGAKDLVRRVDTDSATVFTELAAGDIREGQMVHAIYDGTRFQMLTESGLKLLDYVSAAGTDTYTATPVPAYTSYNQLSGVTLRVLFNNANTTASTLNLNGLGATPVRKYKDQELVAGDIKALQICDLAFDGTQFQLLSELGQAPPDIAVVGQSRNLIITTNGSTPNSAVDISADEIVLRTTSSINYLATSVSISGVAITASGAGGLDAGAEAASTWYYIWVIYNPTTATKSGLLSTSSTAPTMPSGYTYKALAGVVRNDGSSNFVQFYQRGNNVGITVTDVSLSAIGGNWAALSGAVLTAFQAAVPSIAKTISGSAQFTTGAGVGGMRFATSATAGGTAAAIGEVQIEGTGGVADQKYPFSLVLKDHNIYHRDISTTSNEVIAISGYTL